MRRRRIVHFLPLTSESHGAAPSAEHLAMEMRLSGPLARALARIPERQRAALLLAEVHDLTGLELAETLGISHVAARALLTRARESLRQALADEKRKEKDREAAIDAAYGQRARGRDSSPSTDDTTEARR
jgi:RNA polymerase sigma-70 factor (ECF subfamily)